MEYSSLPIYSLLPSHRRLSLLGVDDVPTLGYDDAFSTAVLATVKQEQEIYRYQQRKQQLDILRRSERITERKRFALFLKILSRQIKKSGDTELLETVQQAVRICNERHKMGDTLFASTIDSISNTVRPLVGDFRWFKAQRYMRYYCSHRKPKKTRGKQAM